MKEIAGKALIEYHNQYPSLLGVPELREAVARHSESQQGIPCNAATDTLITVGATEGIAACMLGLINPGDEVRGRQTDTHTHTHTHTQRHTCTQRHTGTLGLIPCKHPTAHTQTHTQRNLLVWMCSASCMQSKSYRCVVCMCAHR